MKHKHKLAHMQVAKIYADLSSCNRRQVGCVIVKDGTPIAIGYNGTAPGDDNNCEEDSGETKTSVRHAEDNALRKLTRSTVSAEGSSLFVTLSPCQACAERIIDAGITEVFYVEQYKGTSGLSLLADHSISVTKLDI